ncbi:hypothetical protein EDEG_00059 [Edhazardia aedis USNM 41457]|uniref:Uncharacterized protein n=1 Tax=Edhazardia aedis (strain USNM 41457) TaxID=1003232 RepID=J9DCL3_EDHAE|nr:hypothetical protein EDEG_00059 [Edhazardia aedis USNM 41457]|eukprot:EJW05204.1 hypothetical protein EDEG_00059 [Edhazardia aedis USNM 41457]
MSDLLRNEKDFDVFFNELESAKNYISTPNDISSNQVSYLMYHNLLNPSKESIKEVVFKNQHILNDFIHKLKYILKFKMKAFKANVVTNVFNMLHYLIQILHEAQLPQLDTLIVNTLRLKCIPELQEIIDPIEFLAINFLDKLENSSPYTYHFLLFFFIDDVRYYGSVCRRIINSENKFCEALGKDFVFRNVYVAFEKAILEGISSLKPMNDFDIESFFKYSTQKSFLTSKISSELEINMVSMLENNSMDPKNSVNTLLEYYVFDIESAKDILRYLVAVYFTVDFVKLSNFIVNLLSRFYYSNYLLFAIFYDVILPQSDFQANRNKFIAEFMIFSIDANNKPVIEFIKKLALIDFFNSNIYNYLSKIDCNKKLIYNYFGFDNTKKNDMKREVEVIKNLDFDGLYRLLQDIKISLKPLVQKDQYNQLIEESGSWDGYVQTFFWQILIFQKTYLGMEIDFEPSLLSSESKIGYEIFCNSLRKQSSS